MFRCGPTDTLRSVSFVRFGASPGTLLLAVVSHSKPRQNSEDVQDVDGGPPAADSLLTCLLMCTPGALKGAWAERQRCVLGAAAADNEAIHVAALDSGVVFCCTERSRSLHVCRLDADGTLRRVVSLDVGFRVQTITASEKLSDPGEQLLFASEFVTSPSATSHKSAGRRGSRSGNGGVHVLRVVVESTEWARQEQLAVLKTRNGRLLLCDDLLLSAAWNNDAKRFDVEARRVSPGGRGCEKLNSPLDEHATLNVDEWASDLGALVVYDASQEVLVLLHLISEGSE